MIVFTHSWPPPGSRRRWCRWAGLWLASRSRRWACRCPAGRPGSPSMSGPGTETGGVAPSASYCSEQTRPAQEACRGRTHTHTLRNVLLRLTWQRRQSLCSQIHFWLNSCWFFSTCVKSFNSLDPNCPSFTSLRAVIVSPCCKMCTIFGEAVFNRDRENKQLPSDGNEVSAPSSVGSAGKTKFCSQCWQYEALRGNLREPLHSTLIIFSIASMNNWHGYQSGISGELLEVFSRCLDAQGVCSIY